MCIIVALLSFAFCSTLSAHNIGSREHPALMDGCILGKALDSELVEPSAMECLWRPDAPFRGWQGSGAGVTGYARYLKDIAAF